jgi:hypothetical protein
MECLPPTGAGCDGGGWGCPAGRGVTNDQTRLDGITREGNIMKTAIKATTVLLGTLLAAGSGFVFVPRSALAAHAGAPYTNVDPSNDRGNDTGDSQVDDLNQRQLEQNYWHDAQRPGGVPNPPYYPPPGAPR